MKRKNIQNVRTRFAPSPTGSLHIGGLRTALYSYALARVNDGIFILRIEDTDKNREVPGSKEEIQKILQEFGLKWDEFYVQSQRVGDNIYKNAAKKLLDAGYAFYCQCDPKNAKKDGYSKELRDPCREKNLSSGAVKLKVPDGEKVSYIDYVFNKEITWNTDDVADATLLKSDEFPTYHLAVVVDDTDMKISHVLRGYDWLPSTPIHLLVYKYLGFDMPEIGHLTDILDPDGGKLSKRKGSVSVEAMLSDGYVKEALLNFLMLLGWAPKNDQEIFSLEEFVNVFGNDGLQRSNPVFNRDKLRWMNSQYLHSFSDEEFAKRAQSFVGDDIDHELLIKIAPLVKTRIDLLSEFMTIAGFFFETPDVKNNMLKSDADKHLKKAYEVLSDIEAWELENINNALMSMIEKEDFKVGKFFMNFRIAITGSSVTPPINESIEILGKDETLSRLKKFI